MANVKLIFQGTDASETDATELKCYSNFRNEIFIQIEDEDMPPSYICLDIPTAIKLSKVLRQEINKAKEVKNV
jgi:hypothetical protein